MKNFTKGAVTALSLLTLSLMVFPSVFAQNAGATAENGQGNGQWREQREERRAEFESMTFEEKKEHMLTRIDENITRLTEVRGQIAAATTEEELFALRGPRMPGEGMGMGLGKGMGMRGPGMGKGLGGPAFNNQSE